MSGRKPPTEYRLAPQCLPPEEKNLSPAQVREVLSRLEEQVQLIPVEEKNTHARANLVTSGKPELQRFRGSHPIMFYGMVRDRPADEHRRFLAAAWQMCGVRAKLDAGATQEDVLKELQEMTMRLMIVPGIEKTRPTANGPASCPTSSACKDTPTHGVPFSAPAAAPSSTASTPESRCG